MVVAIAILVGLMGQLYALQLTPLYTAQATLMLDAGKQKIINSEAVLAGPDARHGAIESDGTHAVARCGAAGR